MHLELKILLPLAAFLGFFHTIVGPDHYLPFVVISKAKKWSKSKTSLITSFCGIGHVLSSIAIGFIGIGFGLALDKLEWFESLRGEIAGWLLIIFGLMYFIYGIRKAYKNKEHKHVHAHSDGIMHIHNHSHKKEHVHIHEENRKFNITPWVLFVIFAFGPCEVLIPMLMYPAAKGSMLGVFYVAFVFSISTILTMLIMVLSLSYGLKFIAMKKFERYSDALAGAAISLSGLTINVLGL